MDIVFAPHPALRQKAQPITKVDKKLMTFIKDISHTLMTNERRGVGLAAPQVDKQWRMFITYLSPNEDRDDEDDEHSRILNIYLNPRIVKTSLTKELGGTEESRPLEGCLSIPKLYGPVPRYQWVEVEYEKIQGDQLVSSKKMFTDFAARLAQHEIDHLDGILFTDYTLELDLPLYRENNQGKLKELDDRTIVEMF
jgi:peptide deformylase